MCSDEDMGDDGRLGAIDFLNRDSQVVGASSGRGSKKDELNSLLHGLATTTAAMPE